MKALHFAKLEIELTLLLDRVNIFDVNLKINARNNQTTTRYKSKSAGNVLVLCLYQARLKALHNAQKLHNFAEEKFSSLMHCTI